MSQFTIRTKHNFNEHDTVDSMQEGKQELNGNPEFLLYNEETEDMFHWNHETEEIEETSIGEFHLERDHILNHEKYLNYAIDFPEDFDGFKDFLIQSYIYRAIGTDEETKKVWNGNKYTLLPNHDSMDTLEHYNMLNNVDVESVDVDDFRMLFQKGYIDTGDTGDTVEIDGNQFARIGTIPMTSEHEIQANTGKCAYWYVGNAYGIVYAPVEYFQG